MFTRLLIWRAAGNLCSTINSSPDVREWHYLHKVSVQPRGQFRKSAMAQTKAKWSGHLFLNRWDASERSQLLKLIETPVIPDG